MKANYFFQKNHSPLLNINWSVPYNLTVYNLHILTSGNPRFRQSMKKLLLGQKSKSDKVVLDAAQETSDYKTFNILDSGHTHSGSLHDINLTQHSKNYADKLLGWSV